MIFEKVRKYQCNDFTFKVAETPWDLAGYWKLRRDIFCEEQEVFSGSDRDVIDEHAMAIICKPIVAGMEDNVAGVVRIDERRPGVWYGSRLGVAKDFRRVRSMSPAASIRNRQPTYQGLGTIGASLIYKAVSTAHRIGCHQFLATVQFQNEKFFRRLHWESKDEIELHGIKHIVMEADLNYYQPAKLAV